MSNSAPMHAIGKRPLSVTVIAIVFLVTGLVGLADVANRLAKRGPLERDLLWVGIVRLLAVVGAVLILRGRNSGRWLLVCWMAFHIGVSALHSPFQLLVHSLLFAAIAYFLFRRPASAYFRGSS